MTIENTEPVQEQSPIRPLSRGVLDISRRIERIERIVQLSGKYEIDPKQAGKTLEVLLYNTEPSYSLDGDQLNVVVGFVFHARKKPKSDSPSSESASEAQVEPGEKAEISEPPVYVSVSASFAIAYALSPIDDRPEPSDEELAGFAEVNGHFNATAYWREFLHSSLSRGGLPPYLVEPYNAAQRINELDKK